jgi:membrane-associated protease RseP (regulator of RpoE activity)
LDTTLYVILGLVAAYVVFVVWLVQSKRLEKWNLSLLLGIILMIRTNRGKPTIDWLAKPRRSWNALGDVGIVLSLAIMLLMTVFFLYLATLVFQEDSPVPALGPAEILVIPGVTPFVPLGYGVLALVVTLVVHEGGHGILARANGMKLKSVGLLYAVIPIGAFVEPDDLDMKVASRRQRLRVFAAGPTVNFAVAAMAHTGFALMMGSLTEIPGTHLGLVAVDGPAGLAGLAAGDTISFVQRPGQAEWQPIRDYPELQQVLNQSRWAVNGMPTAAPTRRP